MGSGLGCAIRRKLTRWCSPESIDLSDAVAALQYFPLFFDLRSQKVLIVGGGEVALRKAVLLERAGAAITLVAPHVVRRARARALRRAASTVVLREFVPEDLDGRTPRDRRHGTPRFESLDRLAVRGARAFPSTWSTIARHRGSSCPRSWTAIPSSSRYRAPAPRPCSRVAGASGSRRSSPTRIGELALWLRGSAAGESTQAPRHGRAAPLFRDARRRTGRRALRRGRRARGRAARSAAARRDRRRAARAPVTSTLVGAGPGDPELLTLKALRALRTRT